MSNLFEQFEKAYLKVAKDLMCHDYPPPYDVAEALEEVVAEWLKTAAETQPERPLTQVRYEWGVMFSDGSVRQQYNGRTAMKRATEDAAFLREKYAPDNIRVVSRAVYVGDWEEPDKQDDGSN